MPSTVERMRARLFANTPRDRDAYHRVIKSCLVGTTHVLDLGCGKGVLNPFAWHAHPEARIVGIDPDPEASSNPNLQEFYQLRDGEPWAVADGRFDLVVCRYVLEHVADPDAFLTELHRVLKPGGRFVFLTPSRYYPVMLVSHFLPHQVHQRLLARTKKSAANDVFATHYAMNDKRTLRRQAHQYGFEVALLQQRDFQPADYFDFNVIPFTLNLVFFGFCKLVRLDRQIGASLLGMFVKQ
jgi:SAM-dependent methyltransferase